jgi:hypothetical protein
LVDVISIVVGRAGPVAATGESKPCVDDLDLIVELVEEGVKGSLLLVELVAEAVLCECGGGLTVDAADAVVEFAVADFSGRDPGLAFRLRRRTVGCCFCWWRGDGESRLVPSR